MSDINVTVQIPKQDDTQSIEYVNYTKTAVTGSDTVTLACKFDGSGNVVDGVFENKNNSLQITVENGYNSDYSKAIITAGDKYPNKILGDQAVDLGKASTPASTDEPVVPKMTTFLIEDISRFENTDGSIEIEFTDNFQGNIWAVAKRAGIMSKAEADIKDGIS